MLLAQLGYGKHNLLVAVILMHANRRIVCGCTQAAACCDHKADLTPVPVWLYSFVLLLCVLGSCGIGVSPASFLLQLLSSLCRLCSVCGASEHEAVC